MAWTKPKPYVEETLRPFFDGLKQHRLLLHRCTQCGAWYWPASFCRFHKNKPLFGNMSWEEATGRAKVISFNITRTATRPEFADITPYVYALVQTEEGPVLSSNIIGCDPDDVTVDMDVEVVYRDIDDLELTLPYFTPRTAS